MAGEYRILSIPILRLNCIAHKFNKIRVGKGLRYLCTLVDLVDH